jgi:hypothetical protein
LIGASIRLRHNPIDELIHQSVSIGIGDFAFESFRGDFDGSSCRFFPEFFPGASKLEFHSRYAIAPNPLGTRTRIAENSLALGLGSLPRRGSDLFQLALEVSQSTLPLRVRDFCIGELARSTLEIGFYLVTAGRKKSPDGFAGEIDDHPKKEEEVGGGPEQIPNAAFGRLVRGLCDLGGDQNPSGESSPS